MTDLPTELDAVLALVGIDAFNKYYDLKPEPK